MGKWATVLRLGRSAVRSDAARSVGNAVIHPQRTLVGAGQAVKTAAVGGGVGYLAWETLVNDKPMVRTAADVLIGEKAVDSTLEAGGNVVDKMESIAESTGEKLTAVSDSVSSLNETWSGIGTFLRNITSGNGLNMLGNFFSNIGKGNVSGMSMLGLVASAFLVFGRFGWLGKIGGLLMSMMLIGNNSRQTIAQTPIEPKPEVKGSENAVISRHR